jgi:hypothetical protein
MWIRQLLFRNLESRLESPIRFSDPYHQHRLHSCHREHGGTLYRPFIKSFERIWDLAESLQLDMGLSGDFTLLPIGLDIFELLRLELGE